MLIHQSQNLISKTHDLPDMSSSIVGYQTSHQNSYYLGQKPHEQEHVITRYNYRSLDRSAGLPANNVAQVDYERNKPQQSSNIYGGIPSSDAPLYSSNFAKKMMVQDPLWKGQIEPKPVS